ncbi:hypothetical protein L873DRAFT_444892 [Choiromyces venosus 120613-1]|uniref:Uncharacterized protein n=1 Tax=Choiromyces venosus 120613-1 TaxID=1336337 RepID=A0A3N4IVW6_9PEZI|nr:hypothetical protein L873DRAFT_444892 [Choiromyces venosus 120613-1]
MHGTATQFLSSFPCLRETLPPNTYPVIHPETKPRSTHFRLWIHNLPHTSSVHPSLTPTAIPIHPHIIISQIPFGQLLPSYLVIIVYKEKEKKKSKRLEEAEKKKDSVCDSPLRWIHHIYIPSYQPWSSRRTIPPDIRCFSFTVAPPLESGLPWWQWQRASKDHTGSRIYWS